MHWRYKAVSLVVCTATLTGCSSFNHWVANSKTFHNREQDYLHQTVAERGPLKTPEGLQQPHYNPAFDLPKQSHTLKPGKGIAMTPPTVTNSGTQALQQTLDQLQSQLEQMRQEQAKQPSTASSPSSSAVQVSQTTASKAPESQDSSGQASPPSQGGLFDHPKPQRPLSQTPANATQTEVVTLDYDADTDTLVVPTKPQTISVSLDYDADSDSLVNANPVQQPVTQPTAQQPTQAVSMTLADDTPMPVIAKPPVAVAPVTQSETQPPHQPLLQSPFSVSMNQTQSGVPFVSVEGRFAEVWRATQIAIEHLGYRVTQMDQQNGYLFIQPTQQPNQQSRLLYVQQQGQQIHLILYDEAGNPSTTAAAENMLSSLATELMQTP